MRLLNQVSISYLNRIKTEAAFLGQPLFSKYLKNLGDTFCKWKPVFFNHPDIKFLEFIQYRVVDSG